MIYYKKKIQQDVGATAIEYGLIASLIGVLAVSGMSAVGMNLSNTYCTVSKYLGGSGECSGSTNSNSSGSSSTGSGGNGDPITQITTEDDMNKLKDSLLDNFNDGYLDSSLGGENSDAPNSEPLAGSYLSLMNAYNQKNPDDQITHVFGLYDKSTHQPITSWEKASEGLEAYANGNRLIESGTKDGPYGETIEVTTAQGHVYTVDAGFNNMSEQLMKGS
ncbi:MULTISPECIES: Flp family type IVb pilin [Acetobacter]|uniref:Flp family type IVb pilin n=1 Tax=Acetobacter TaxID=434 RepID=UPI0037704176